MVPIGRVAGLGNKFSRRIGEITMFDISSISSKKLNSVRAAFINQNDWNVDLIPILILANQKDASIKSICNKMSEGLTINMKDIRGRKIRSNIFPFIFIRPDFEGKSMQYTFEDLLTCFKDDSKSDYVLSFLSEAKQVFPVYDQQEHKQMVKQFFDEMQRILLKGLFNNKIKFISNDLVLANLSLLFNICTELVKREFGNIEDLFWQPLLNRYNTIDNAKPHLFTELNDEIYLTKPDDSSWTLCIIDNCSSEVAKDFYIMKGCKSLYVPQILTNSLRKRDDVDRKVVKSRLFLSILSENKLLQSIEKHKNILSEPFKDTIGSIIKHLREESEND